MTLDNDVAMALKRLRRARDAALKDLVNEALRRGLREMTARPPRRPPFRTRSVDCGRVLIGGIDNIAEVLAVAEGETFR